MGRCAICRCYANNLLCVGCQSLVQQPQYGCTICDKPLPKAEHKSDTLLCADCRQQKPVYDRVRCAGIYQPPASDWVLALKFSGQLHWARAMAELMSPVIADLPQNWPLIAMPLHPGRLRQRGFNQAYEIGRLISQISGRSKRTDVLIRSQVTAMQATLPEKKRRSNVRNAFSVETQNLPESLILIDDVLTTGHTLSAAAAVLKKAGVKQVYGAVFLRAGA